MSTKVTIPICWFSTCIFEESQRAAARGQTALEPVTQSPSQATPPESQSPESETEFAGFNKEGASKSLSGWAVHEVEKVTECPEELGVHEVNEVTELVSNDPPPGFARK